MLRHGLLVKSGSFLFNKANGAQWAVTDAGSESVAIVLPNQSSLSVHQTEGSFVTSGNALPTAIAQVPVNLNYLPDHKIVFCFRTKIIPQFLTVSNQAPP
jgi:hypothetical protein